MKTNLISKAVVMLAVVMASVMNFSASASNPTQYVKNEEMIGELMTAKTIFKNEDGVHPTFRVIRQSCSAYSLSSKYRSFLNPYAVLFITFILLFMPSTFPVEI